MRLGDGAWRGMDEAWMKHGERGEFQGTPDSSRTKTFVRGNKQEYNKAK